MRIKTWNRFYESKSDLILDLEEKIIAIEEILTSQLEEIEWSLDIVVKYGYGEYLFFNKDLKLCKHVRNSLPEGVKIKDSLDSVILNLARHYTIIIGITAPKNFESLEVLDSRIQNEFDLTPFDTTSLDSSWTPVFFLSNYGKRLIYNYHEVS